MEGEGRKGRKRTQRLVAPYLQLRVRPPRDLDHEVYDLLVGLVGPERDVVPERNGLPFLLEPEAPFLESNDPIAPVSQRIHSI